MVQKFLYSRDTSQHVAAATTTIIREVKLHEPKHCYLSCNARKSDLLCGLFNTKLDCITLPMYIELKHSYIVKLFTTCFGGGPFWCMEFAIPDAGGGRHQNLLEVA